MFDCQSNQRTNEPTNKLIHLLSAILLLSLLIAGSIRTEAASHLATTPESLSPCEGSSFLFPREPGQSIDLWVQRYHTNVAAVLAAHAQEQPSACTLGTPHEPASVALTSLGHALPPWQNRASLREEEISPVLLEYLRVYECTLKEHELFLTDRTAAAIAAEAPLGRPLTAATVSARMLRDLRRIREELTIAPRALQRTLLFLGHADRLRPLQSALHCLERASLDIRNILGLAADASACLPRIWDARSALRNP